MTHARKKHQNHQMLELPVCCSTGNVVTSRQGVADAIAERRSMINAKSAMDGRRYETGKLFEINGRNMGDG